MQTKIINTYDITELEGAAREKALSWLMEGLDYEWWNYIYDDAKKCAGILGIEISDIYFSGFYSHGSGACFDGRFSYARGWKKALKAYAPDAEMLRIGQSLQDIQRHYLYNIEGAIISNDRYYNTKCGSADIDGRFADVPGSVIDDLTECFSDFASWIYINLRTEWEWLTSEEQLIETAQGNGYMFDSEGRII